MGCLSAFKRKKGLSGAKDQDSVLLKNRLSMCSTFGGAYGDVNPLIVFTPRQLDKATNVKRVHRGFYDTVHSGVLDDCDGRRVLIKTFHRDSPGLNATIQEIAALSTVRHPNVVKLLGYCLQSHRPKLVFDYYRPYTTVRNHIAQRMSCHDRLRITIQVAEAISYIHSNAPKPILHRNIRPENIWFDENFNAKLSAFQYSVAMPPDKTEVEESLVGNLGYIDPAVINSKSHTEKSDVFSFGVLLLWVVIPIFWRRGISSSFVSCDTKASSGDTKASSCDTKASSAYIDIFNSFKKATKNPTNSGHTKASAGDTKESSCDTTGSSAYIDIFNSFKKATKNPTNRNLAQIQQMIQDGIMAIGKATTTNLALVPLILECIKYSRDERPSMIQVTKRLYAIRDMEAETTSP